LQQTHGGDVHVEKLSKHISVSSTEEEELSAPMPLCQLGFKFSFFL